MATAFEERIEVVYTLIGDNTPRQAKLIELDKKTRADIEKLTILPIYNKNGKLSTAKKQLENFLEGFSALTSIAYPGQFPNINGNKLRMDNRCPNLRVICHFGHDDIAEKGFLGTINGIEISSPDGKVSSFGEVMGDGGENHSILRHYKFTPKRKVSRASTIIKRPEQPYVVSEKLGDYTQNIFVAINGLNSVIADDTLKFMADEEQVSNLLTILKEMGVEEDVMQRNVDGLVSKLNGLKSSETTTIADNCGSYFSEFFDAVVGQAKDAQRRKLSEAAVNSVKNVTPGDFKNIAVTYLALEEVLTEETLTSKIAEVTENKKNRLIEEKAQSLLNALKREVGEEEFANLSEEDKANRIKDKLDNFVNNEVLSRLNPELIKIAAIDEVNRDAMRSIETLKQSAVGNLEDDEKSRLNRWIENLKNEDLYSLVQSLNDTKVTQEQFEEVLRPTINDNRVRGMFIAAIMLKCNGVVSQEMLEEIKYILSGLPENPTEEEVFEDIEESLVTLGEIEMILNNSHDFVAFSNKIYGLENDEDRKYAQGVLNTLPIEILSKVREDKKTLDYELSKEQLLQAYELYIQSDEFAEIVRKAAEECKIKLVENTNENTGDEVLLTSDDIKGILEDNEDYKKLWRAYRTLSKGDVRESVREDVIFMADWVLGACLDDVENKPILEEKMEVVRNFVSGTTYKEHIEEIVRTAGLNLEDYDKTILVTLDDVNDILFDNELYANILYASIIMQDGENKIQAKNEIRQMAQWVYAECKNLMSKYTTLDEQLNVISNFVEKEEYKNRINEIENKYNLSQANSDISEIIIKELANNQQCLAINDYISNMPNGKPRQELMVDFMAIECWVFAECKKSLGLISNNPTQEQIANFVNSNSFKHYMDDFAERHGIQLTVEEPKSSLSAWQKDIATNIKFISTLAQLKNDIKDEGTLLQVTNELMQFVIAESSSEIGTLSDENAQIAIVRELINSDRFDNKVVEIYKTYKIEMPVEESEDGFKLEFVINENEDFKYFINKINAEVTDENKKLEAIAKAVAFVTTSCAKEIEKAANNEDAIRQVINNFLSNKPEFTAQTHKLYVEYGIEEGEKAEENPEEFNWNAVIVNNGNFKDFMENVSAKITSEDEKRALYTRLITFVIVNCDRTVSEEKDNFYKTRIVNNFINSLQFRREIAKIYKEAGIENITQNDQEHIVNQDVFEGLSNQVLFDILTSTDTYVNFVEAVNGLNIEESTRLAMVSSAVNFVKENCESDVLNSRLEMMKRSVIKAFLKSGEFTSYTNNLIEANTPPAAYTATAVNNDDLENTRELNVDSRAETNPADAIDLKEIKEALNEFIEFYRGKTREVTLSGDENATSIIPLLAGAENIKIGSINFINNNGTMEDVNTSLLMDSENGEMSFNNRVDNSTHTATATASGDNNPSPSIESMFGIIPNNGTNNDDGKTTVNENANIANGEAEMANNTIPVTNTNGFVAGNSVVQPQNKSDRVDVVPGTIGVGTPNGTLTATPTAGNSATATAQNLSRGATANAGGNTSAVAGTPANGNVSANSNGGQPGVAIPSNNGASQKGATIPSGKGVTNPQTDSKSGEKSPKKGESTPKTTTTKDAKKDVELSKEELPKVRLIEFATKELDKVNEPKLPWYKRMAKWVVRHPIATTAICLGAGALLAAGAGVVAAGGLSPAISALSFSLPKIAAISGAVGVGAGAVIGGGLLIGSNISKTGKKEKLYKKFEKKYKKCQSLEDSISEYKDIINATKDKQKQLEEKHRKSKGVLKALGVYKKARKKVRKQNRKFTQKMREAEIEYAETVEEAIDKKNELNTIEDTTSSLALGGYFEKKKKVEKDFKSGKIDKEDYDFEMEDLEDEVPGISKTSSRLKTFDGEVSELISKVKKEHSSKKMSEAVKEIKARHSKEEPVVVEEYDFSEDSVMSAMRKKHKKQVEASGKTFDENDFSTSYEALKKAQKKKVDDYVAFGKSNPDEFKKANKAFDEELGKTEDKGLEK